MTAARREFLTVEQAAAICGIGRTVAYELARRAADHGEGELPAIRLGKQLRVPRRKLEALIGGPITLPTDPPAAPTDSTPSLDQPATPTTPSRHTAHAASNDQPSLPFTTP